ncbi:MAG: tetratricopeptide repeat protein [Brevundimonas sp.]
MSKAFKFNPGFLNDEEAVANFVVRRHQLDTVLSVFESSPGGSTARVLVLAPRGAGKTTLCRRVLAENRGEGRLSQGWHAIFLGEESYVVTTPGEFFLECLFHLRDQTPGAVPEAHYQAAVAASGEDELIETTLSALREFVVTRRQRLLIIVENFHIILHDQIGTDAARLLSLLSDATLFGVLATSVAQGRIDDEDPDVVPADYVRVHLEPLTLEECHTLWEAITGQSVRRERIRPLEILTGGSPRLLHILADFMRTPSLQDLMANLNQLIDQNTEYFKSQLDALPPMERKVFAALLDAWDPQSAKQIAEQARVNTNTASTMLGRLSDRGAVIRGPAEGRATIYYAAERLFNIYYLMRRRSHPSNRVRALVSFMTGYYDQDELVKTTALLVREACAIAPELRGDYHSTFDAILSRAEEGVRKQILEQTPKEFIRVFRRDRSLLRIEEPDLFGSAASTDEDAEIAKRTDEFEAAADRGDFEHALSILGSMLDRWPELPGAWLRLALVHQRLDDHQASIAPAEKAIALAPEDAWAKAVLGRAFVGVGDRPRAIDLFQQALQRDPAQVMAAVGLAELREEEGDVDAAIAIYERARAVGPMPDLLWSRFGMLLAEAGRNDEAEVVLKAALAENVENLDSRRILVDMLNDAERTDEAIDILRSAAFELNNAMGWADLGLFLHTHTDRADEAQEALEASISHGMHRAMPFRALAQRLILAEASPEQLRSLAATAVTQIQNKAEAFDLAGDFYALLDEDAEAENAYRASIHHQDNVGARVGLARILAGRIETQSEAEAILRQAIADPQRPGVCAASRELAELLVHKGDEAGAEQVVDDALNINETCVCCLLLQGQICARRGDTDGATKSFDAVLRLEDESVTALTGLALVDPAQAEPLLARAMALAPDNPRTLFARAKLLNHGAPEAQISDLRAAIVQDETFLPAVLMLAGLEARRGELSLALECLRQALNRLPVRREWLSDFVDTAMAVARLSDVDAVLALVQEHEAAITLEPLIVALRLQKGERPRVAKEVLEVAKDILGRH